MNGSIVETNTITIVGVINVTGNVVVANDSTVKLSPGSVLHVGKCLLVEENSEIVIVVEGGMSGNEEQLVATYDGNCSSSELLKRVRVETTSSFDECRDGQPTVQESKNENGRSQLAVLFVPVSECDSESSELNIVAIAIAVPIAVIVIVMVIVVMAVPQVRKKVFPFARRMQ